MPWEEMAPWREDPGEALRALQARFVQERYDLPQLVRASLMHALEQIALEERAGDPYGLLPGYRKKVAMLKATSAAPVPADPHEQVILIREIFSDSGEGIGNVLDVEGISAEVRPLYAHFLSDEDLQTVFGTTKPSPAMASLALSMLADKTGRGESFCFPVYNTDGAPVGWWFAGYTID